MNDIITLGIHIGHDRCAAVIKNGLLIGSIAQERVDRIKHSSSSEIPYEAIEKLLTYLSIDIDSISYIGITFSSVNACELEDYFYEELRRHYPNAVFTVVPVSHHQAHAEIAYDTSDFDKALIFIADGGGDCVNGQYEAESLFIGNGEQISLLEQRYQTPPVGSVEKMQNYIYPFMDKTTLDRQISIGRKYEQITYMLGFRWGECGKTMGLASYGYPLWDVSKLNVSGLEFDLRLKNIVQEVYGRALYSGKPYFTFLQEERANIAQTVQKAAEHLIVQCLKDLVSRYDIQNVCLAGGTFLNCMLNHKILEQIEGIRLHICPAAGDDGQAAGAAFAAYRKSGRPIKRTSTVLPYLGISYENEDILNTLMRTNLQYRYLEDSALISELAQQIKANKIVAILRGKSEFGPRALGHRSILCNPSWSGMKDYLNERVKHREAFRPFAPMVTYEDAFTIFDLRQDSPYMLLACQVREDFRDKIPSVVHIDGTARVQTVHKESEPFLHALLEEYKRISGTAVLLNTSFNDNGQPMVESPLDAVSVFLNTNIDILVMENYIVSKSNKNTIQEKSGC